MMGERIGLFGGTFSPPHIGHMQAACAAREQLALDRLLLIPALMPPHKELSGDTPPPEMRLEMLRLASQNMPFAEVSDIEIKRGGKSFTADTVAELKKAYPDAQLFLLMGGDMFLTLEEWYRFEAIVGNTVLAPFARSENEGERLKSYTSELIDKYGAEVKLVKNEAIEISSTEIRELLEQRKGLNFLGDAVYSYIIKNRLYGAKPNFDWLRGKALSQMDPKRVPHVIGCEKEAVRLAKRWAADGEEARTAAILHDITKKYEIDEQLILCEKYAIITDNIEKAERKLLHSKTGAAVAKYEYGVSDAVFWAINWHTTGKADMSLLEKVLYIADYIEETREFEGLELLRAIAYEDLDRAVLTGLKMSVEDMRERGIAPHPNTMDAIAFLQK